jgi:hypothetical protein
MDHDEAGRGHSVYICHLIEGLEEGLWTLDWPQEFPRDAKGRDKWDINKVVEEYRYGTSIIDWIRSCSRLVSSAKRRAGAGS